MKIDYKVIGTRIRAERTNLKLSREELSEKIGISPYFLGQIERAERKMSVDTLVNISYSLNISIDELIFNQAEYDSYNNLKGLFNGCSDNELNLFEDIIKIIKSHFAQ